MTDFLASQVENKNVLVDMRTKDDAGVYLLNETTALVETVDFITPLVDDPYDFGQVAAANALSDVYAMGGTPLTAMNICMFPKKLPLESAVAVLKGGLSKIQEAGAYLIGGQTVEDSEMKYGLAVTGIVAPEHLTPNSKAQVGELFILTKPLGTGVLITAMRNKKILLKDFQPALDSMKALNKTAAEIARRFQVRCCTDITGFGLAGHAFGMAQASTDASHRPIRLRFRYSKLPVFEPFFHFLKKKQSTRVTETNRRVLEKVPGRFVFKESFTLLEETLFFDPQTSGGLLFSVSPSQAESCLKSLKEAGLSSSAIVGECIAGEQAGIEVIR
jgi:selenide,water dikinase